MHIYPKRIERIKNVVASRQHDLTVVLENVHDPHNIGAVLRSCDSVGISEIYVIYTDPLLMQRGLDIGITSASGALQWIKIHYFTDLSEAFNAIKFKYDHVFGTVIKEDSKDLYDLNLSDSAAFLFGNEHSGISEEAQTYIDSNFVIPQHGFVQSLNISVACAVTLYEAQRQRLSKNKYNREFGSDPQDALLNEHYLEVHRNKKLVKAEKRVYL
jgi:tRNA (guanosine-2'-O-)-methyltransferase